LNGFTILEKAETSEELRNIETIIVLRILNNLGYIGAGDAVDTLIQSPFEENLVFEASKERTKILKAINKALKETHL